MKSKFIITIILIASYQLVFAQNPICPPGIYIADPSAKVFNGKLYLYGSTDVSCEHWCSWHHDVISTNDMVSWVFTNNVFHSKGLTDEVPYNDNLLFAPDCELVNDTFYLFYCQPENIHAEGVATSTSPTGPFANGKAIDLFGHHQIDPSCFIDDDVRLAMCGVKCTLIAHRKPPIESSIQCVPDDNLFLISGSALSPVA